MVEFLEILKNFKCKDTDTLFLQNSINEEQKALLCHVGHKFSLLTPTVLRLHLYWFIQISKTIPCQWNHCVLEDVRLSILQLFLRYRKKKVRTLDLASCHRVGGTYAVHISFFIIYCNLHENNLSSLLEQGVEIISHSFPSQTLCKASPLPLCG